ncbi:unnamed protein product [Mytilus edulis]|uniref:Reverse transcriptase RNase H-like domain-containing protein n=1 Tax=Mytilus edulis TaxID=6550 RepID=A0A8S3S1H0_MYTED|nr:unnamed protein product [Mytilus edulis]
MTIPAHTEMIVNATIQGDSSHIMDAIVEPVMSNHTSNLLIAKALVDPSQGHVPLRIANLTDEVQTVFKSTCTAVCESVDMTQRYEDICKVSQMITKENSEDIPLYLQDMFERSSSIFQSLSPFLVRTDHGALNWLLRFKNPEGQMARWLEVLNTYNFEVQHRPGRLHGNADGLSRRPCYPCSHCNKQDQKEFTNTELEGCIRMAKTKDDIEDQNTEDETQWDSTKDN